MDSLSDLFHCNIEARNDSEDLQQDKEWSELYDLDAFFGRETRSRCSSEESTNSVVEARSNSCSHYVESLNKCEDDCSVGLSIEEVIGFLQSLLCCSVINTKRDFNFRMWHHLPKVENSHMMKTNLSLS